MKDFKTIETDFLKIENEDNEKLIEFHKKYLETLNTIDFLDEEITKKKIWMLSEISEAYYQNGQTKKGSHLTKLAIELFEKFSKKFNYNLNEDTNYRNLMLDIAGRYFDRKNFLKARKYYLKLSGWKKYENEVQDFIKICKFNFIKRINKIIGLFGLLLIVINYSIKYSIGDTKLAYILGMIGAILLISFGLIETFYKKANR